MPAQPVYPPFIPVFGAGAPGASVPHTAIYYDNTTNPYTSYVYVPGTGWQAFGALGAGVNASAIQGVAVAATAPTDGQVLRYNAGSGEWEPYDGLTYTPAFFVPGSPTGGQLVYKFVAVKAFTLPINLTGSKVNADGAATGAVSFNILKNGASIGTINFAIGGTNATFTFAAAVSFAIGDILKITAPNPADATLANIAFSLLGEQA